VDELFDASSAMAAPAKVKTLTAPAAINRKFMTNLHELVITKQ
jgi:hypothetical protein